MISEKSCELRREVRSSGFQFAENISQEKGYISDLHFWQLRLRVFDGFCCIWSFIELPKPGRNTDVACEKLVQFLQEVLGKDELHISYSV